MPRRAFLFFALSLLIFIRADLALAESIYSFDVEINVNQDSSFLVKEKILYNFGNLQKHGIIRTIPLDKVGSIKVISITDLFSQPYHYQLSKEGGDLKIKIGDEDKTVTGSHWYNILYQVKGGLGFFDDHDELYWNVTGNKWPVSIGNAQVAISLPQPVSESDLKFRCFVGQYGSTSSACSWQVDTDGKIIFKALAALPPQSGLTVVLGWPKGLTERPLIVLPFWIKQYWPIALPIFSFIFLFIYWWKKGRDFPVKKPIMALYEPPAGLKPGQVGTIMRQKVGSLEISATIVDLAVRGYLKIREIEKTGLAGAFGKSDYEIMRMKAIEGENDLSDYEKDLLETYFPDLLADKLSGLPTLKVSQFRLRSRDFCKLILAGLTSQGYFVSNPERTRKAFVAVGIAIFVALWFFGEQLFSKYALIIGSLFLTGLIFILFSLIMPKRSKKGADIYWQVLGFKEYIDKAEKYRLQFAEKENLFEKYLPYAIVFGSVNKWAAAFEGIYKNPPSWYEGHYPGSFSSLVFVTSFNHAISNMNQVFSGRGAGSSSGFGGGGFSGGGGGGGGGGSW